MYEGPRGRMPWGYEIVPPAPTVKRVVQLWRYLTPEDIIQPGDHYASSMTGQLYRCTPDMMGKKIPYLAMPHLRPSGTMEVTG